MRKSPSITGRVANFVATYPKSWSPLWPYQCTLTSNKWFMLKSGHILKCRVMHQVFMNLEEQIWPFSALILS